MAQRLVFTLDTETYRRLDDARGDEPVDDWVRDAIREKLAGEAEYDDGVEFVDDCAI